MAGLFDIASSGIQAYRSALAVTGQNIANINTEGYRRREADLAEITGSQSGIFTKSDQTGLGVRVEDIRRSFDAFLAGRARDTAADFRKAEAYSTSLETLQTTIAPEEYDIGHFLDRFFDGLSGVGQSPGDLAPRIAALEDGRSLAAGFAEAARTIGWLKDALFGQASAALTELNAALGSLGQTQGRLLSAGQSGSASNALLDERDRQIAAIAEIAGVSVDYVDRGTVRLTLGPTGTGPILIEGLDAGRVALDRDGDALRVMVDAAGAPAETRQLVSGRVAGLVSAFEAADAALRQLDALAAKVTADLNAVHSAGLTLEGGRGRPMFTTDAYVLRPSATNLGRFSATVAAPDIIGSAAGELRLAFDARVGLWRGFDPEGREVVAGAREIRWGDVTVSVSGTPADGDELRLVLTRGEALNMRFLITRPEEFAAAGLTLASPDTGNIGTASLAASVLSAVEPSGLRRLDAILPNDASALAAQRLRQEGVVGVIPAGTRGVDLFSLARQDTVALALDEETIAALGQTTPLIVSLGGPPPATHAFDLAQFGEERAEVIGADMHRLAELLNSGVIRTADDQDFQSLGLHASGDGGNLTIASASGAISAASIAGTGIVGRVSSGNALHSTIQVFTREGRHVAGTPLSPSEVAGLLTESNGFLAGAEYRADQLNGAGGAGYLGMSVRQVLPGGDHVLRLSGSAIAAANTTPPRSLDITLDGEMLEPVVVPEGVTAGYIAQRINLQTPETGLHAAAFTRVELAGFTASPATLHLTGANLVPVEITAGIGGLPVAPDLRELRAAINAKAAQTGIVAVASPDWTRLVLESAVGDDIMVSSNATFMATGVDRLSQQVDAPVSFGGGTTSARIRGQVELRAPAAFGVAGLASADSAADPFTGGVLTRSVDATGTRQEIAFGIVEGIDTNEARPDGLAASASAARYEITIDTPASASGITAGVGAGSLEPPTSAAVAAAIAAAIRAQAPVPSMTGAALVALPEDGAQMDVLLGAQRFTLTMRSGDVAVDGPEAGRIAAWFDANRQLRITAAAGVLSGDALRIPADSIDAAGAFGIGTAGQQGMIAGRSFDPDDVAPDGWPLAIGLAIAGVVHSITVDADLATFGGLPQGVSLAFEGAGSDRQARITLDHSLAGTSVRVVPGAWAAALGLVTAAAQLRVTASGLEIVSADDSPLAVGGAAQSLAGQRITLRDLPDEDLIVVMTGSGGARRLAAAYDVAPASAVDRMPRPVELRMMDAATGRVEIIDSATGHSVATRLLDASGIITAAGYRFELRGSAASGDRFHVGPNVGGVGDGRNVADLLALGQRDPATGRGGFQDIYRALVTDTGAKVRSAELSRSSAEALHDAAAEVESGFAGVNLDNEAARLLEQQQAYQALARALTTARDILDTLLRSI